MEAERAMRSLIGGAFMAAAVILQMGGRQALAGRDELRYGFYQQSCPQLESIVKLGLAHVFPRDIEAPSALLRLLFHDCQVQGCDGSILLQTSGNTTSEMGSKSNLGIMKREVIGEMKAMVEAECPGTVSCADVLVLCAREAVAAAGGPAISVPLGRRDALGTRKEFADNSLPPATATVDAMLAIFAEQKMTVEESVAIMGAHTLGVSHCVNVEGNMGQNIARSPAARERYEAILRIGCPGRDADPSGPFVPNDLSFLTFDNQYYRDLLAGRGVLRVDFEMAVHPRTAPAVERYAADPAAFSRAFASAFVKLASHNVLTGTRGRILRRCTGD